VRNGRELVKEAINRAVLWLFAVVLFLLVPAAAALNAFACSPAGPAYLPWVEAMTTRLQRVRAWAIKGIGARLSGADLERWNQ